METDQTVADVMSADQIVFLGLLGHLRPELKNDPLALGRLGVSLLKRKPRLFTQVLEAAKEEGGEATALRILRRQLDKTRNLI